MKHGPDGTLTKNDYTYSGSWVYNKMQGEGVLQSEQGRYDGEFYTGYKEGSGTFYYSDGKVFRGFFVNNQMDRGELTL